MKKMNIFLVFAMAIALISIAMAQDNPSTNSPMSATASQSDKSNVSSKSNSSDGELTQQLQSRFSQDPAFANVQVSVSKGTALITGSVASKADKKRAKEAAKSIAG
ncbi:MAG TPA: BON domain-containing protein, partial [Terriglobales bacterium]|nr:BON domain-containing protein [Terriglobales bacterium]